MTDRGTLEILANEAMDKVQQHMRPLGGELKLLMPHGVGFAVLVFDFGPAGTGNLAYVSNAQREDMLRAMREFIEKQEKGAVTSVFGGRRS